MARRLRAAGHAVHTPTLTGLGERSHLLRPDIGLDVHVQDLVGVFACEDTEQAVLVAHSYGGAVACAAMECIGPRVRGLVHLDAHMPRTGESVFDLIGSERATQMVALADAHGEGWFLPPSDASAYGVSDPADIAWVNSRTTAQPLKTYRDPTGCTDRAWAAPGMYIECVRSPTWPKLLERARERSVRDDRFHYRRLDAVHDAMVTAPDALTRLLLECVDVVGVPASSRP
ncbi:pimeloyl-ACP methyl ester carboxylesterase [Actinoplanes lutulentus]|nr:pimeloyl-ACP methyl ester carboxylesterase [Actinoplanes lutulentus]